MEAELRKIIALLNEHSVTYWMNHGTLLGLVREGKPIENDADFDIGMWADDEPLVCEKIIPAMKKMGYSMTLFSYHKMNFMYKFKKMKGSLQINVDLHLMRLSGDYAWRPQRGPIDNPYHGIAGWVFRYIRALVSIYAFDYCPLMSNHASLTSWPLRSCLQTGTCWSPAHFFKNLTKLKEWDCLIPRDWDEYLTFKYGDWRTPNKGRWVFWTMEGGLIHKDPLTLIEESEQDNRETETDDPQQHATWGREGKGK